MIRLASFNVNSIRRRVPHLRRFLDRHAPDLVFLQELKCQTAEFPLLELADSGYRVHAVGQTGGRNGVAVLGRIPFEVSAEALPGEDEDGHARFVSVLAEGMEVAGINLPNGNSGGEAGYQYKLRWMERLAGRARALLAEERPTVLAGDYNVIAHDDDTFSVRAMSEDALMQPESRAAYRRLLAQGWTDALRWRAPRGGVWTFWDYQAGAWQRDAGFRIDHLLLSPQAADRLTDAGVDKAYRGREKASDHAPTWVRLR